MESLDFPVVLVSGGSREIVHERALANGDIGEFSVPCKAFLCTIR